MTPRSRTVEGVCVCVCLSAIACQSCSTKRGQSIYESYQRAGKDKAPLNEISLPDAARIHTHPTAPTSFRQLHLSWSIRVICQKPVINGPAYCRPPDSINLSY